MRLQGYTSAWRKAFSITSSLFLRRSTGGTALTAALAAPKVEASREIAHDGSIVRVSLDLSLSKDLLLPTLPRIPGGGQVSEHRHDRLDLPRPLEQARVDFRKASPVAQ